MISRWSKASSGSWSSSNQHTFSSATARCDLVGVHERPVHDRDDALVGGAVGGAERVELLEVSRREARRLGERARRGGVEALVDGQPAAGQRPASGAGLAEAPHERDAQARGGRALVGAEREDDGGDGEPRLRAVVVLLRHPLPPFLESI